MGNPNKSSAGAIYLDLVIRGKVKEQAEKASKSVAKVAQKGLNKTSKQIEATVERNNRLTLESMKKASEKAAKYQKSVAEKTANSQQKVLEKSLKKQQTATQKAQEKLKKIDQERKAFQEQTEKDIAAAMDRYRQRKQQEAEQAKQSIQPREPTFYKVKKSSATPKSEVQQNTQPVKDMQTVKKPELTHLADWNPASNAMDLLKQKLDNVNEQLVSQSQKLQVLRQEYAKLKSFDMGTEKEQKLGEAIQQVQSRMISLQNTALQTENKILQMEQAPIRAAEKAAAAQEKAKQRERAAAERKAAAEEKARQREMAAAERKAAAAEKARQREALAAEKAAQREKAAAERAAQAQQRAEEKAVAAAQKAAQQKLQSYKNAFSKIQATVKDAFSKAGKSMVSFFSRLGKGNRTVQGFGSRLRSIAGGALIFNGISRALTSMTTYFKNAVMSSGQFRDALANLKGAASTAAAPIVQALTPALTALANAAATVFSYISRLFSLLTGKSVASMQASAKATAAYSKSVNGATDAAKELAEANNTLGIDELNVVQADNSNSGSSGGGSGTDVTPNYDFTGQSDFLDSILQSIESGDWYGVGALVAQKLNDVMASINWPSIDKKARQWVGNLVDTLNGFVHNIDWSLLGSTLANGLNVALHCYDDFFQKFDWTGLGRGLGTGLNQMVNTLDWQAVGRYLTNGLKALLETLHRFVASFDFASLGSSLAVAIMAAINNVDWVQGIQDLSSLAVGLLVGLQNLIQGIDWVGIGSTIYQMLAAIDWGGLLANLMKVIAMAATGALLLLGGFLLEALTDLKNKFVSYFTDIGENGIQGLLQGMWNLLCDIGTWLYDNLVKPMVEGVKEMLGIHSPSRVFAEIGQFLIEGLFGGLLEKWHLISGFFTEKFDWAKDKVKTTWKNVQSNTSEMWGSISSSLKNTLSNLGERFGDTWTKLQSSTKGSWSSMTSTIKGAVNVIISFMNQLLSGAGNMINGLIDLLNKFSIDVPADVPIIGGTKFGFSMDHIMVPNIPMLANGGVITQPTLAMMGEYAGASTNPEIVAPESKIRGLLDESMAAMGENINRLVRLLEYHSSKTSTVNQPIEVKLDGQVLYRAMAQVEERQGVKIGGAFAYSY